ncbi:hypothetical protein ASG17_08335 [Brevundimonas sp. Leaf363]|uniref:hypothetical protein n=1 Tax=Brevundimonas sp. Leaf363 TaxID=1736353 RepID=UPI0006FD9915|nr:hypothetical protein [Brevundimonas sp. Leaf363]KQS56036.1 hypothetical protein ASG17_08335 [Brevundimonas sp. Leaf363]
MTHSRADTWSTTRSLAFLAAVFAIVIGSLLPFAAMAAARPGQPLVICSAEGPQTIQVGGLDGPIKKQAGVKCAACVMPLATALPPVVPVQPARPLKPAAQPAYVRLKTALPPPARAPPRPPSTAPPHA